MISTLERPIPQEITTTPNITRRLTPFGTCQRTRKIRVAANLALKKTRMMPKRSAPPHVQNLPQVPSLPQVQVQASKSPTQVRRQVPTSQSTLLPRTRILSLPKDSRHQKISQKIRNSRQKSRVPIQRRGERPRKRARKAVMKPSSLLRRK